MFSKAPNLLRFQKWYFLLWIPVGLYYWRFQAGGAGGMTLYPLAADCLLSGKPLLPCAEGFTYPPAFAFFMIPFAPLPVWLRNLVWYLLSVSLLYFSFRLCEELIVKAFHLRFDQNRLYWFRLLSLALGFKFILAVLENQSYDYLIFFFVLLGISGLAEENDLLASIGIAVAAALKVTPLLFFPYLLFRKKWKVLISCAFLYLFISFLPDLFFSAAENRSGYFVRWVQEIVRPLISPQEGASALRFWEGENPLNQSLRSFVYRLAAESDLIPQFKTILYAVYLLFLFSLFFVVQKSSRLASASLLDGAALMIGMLMLSPMSSKSHFIVLIFPYMVILAYLMEREDRRGLLGPLLLVSFIFNSLTSKDLIGRRLSTFLLSMGCITIGTLLLFVMIGLIVFEMTGRREERSPVYSDLPELE